MGRMSIIVALMSLLSASPCFAGDIKTTAISKDEFGKEWPFTTPTGILGCMVVGQLSGGQVIGAVTFMANGKVYAVNGTARSHAKHNGWHDLKGIWRNDPKAPGLKVSAGAVIDRGLKLCEAG